METAPQTGMSKAMFWIGWVLSVLPAPLLVMSAIGKFRMTPEVAEGLKGLQWPASTMTVLGVVELGALLLYLLPQTAVLGAIILTGYLGGSCAAHVRIEDYAHFWVPIVMGVVLWLGLFFRDARVRALAPIRSL